MKKELQIFIGGTCGSGKSTMMYQLEKLLKENGYDVELSVSDDYKSINDFNRQMLQFEEERLIKLKENTHITLREIQLSHKPIEKESQLEINPQY